MASVLELSLSPSPALRVSELLVPAVEEGSCDEGVFVLAAGIEKVNEVRSGSFGDSNALGIAGTGGTSSSSPAAELCTFLVFGVGNRELASVGLVRMGIEEPAAFKELILELDEMDIPEAYDLRVNSGVARAEDGVSLFRMDIAGDCVKTCSSNGKSASGVGGPTGPPVGFGFVESRLRRRASVGLIVLAPRPKWCGTVDCRLLAEDVGV
jgi:hypothetical protein